MSARASQNPTAVAEQLREVRDAIANAALSAGRAPADITLIAVSKTQPATAVRAAYAAGCRDFGENYVDEAVGKIEALRDLEATWHFIGSIQSNKTRAIATLFDWVHTVERTRIAERLSRQCPNGRVLNVCLQVNIDRDPRKSGVDPEGAAELLAAVSALPNLRVRGLMTLLDPAAVALESYRRLADLFALLRPHARGPWDTLSMGMSGDFPAAIASGATHIRIGTAVFGARLQAAIAREDSARNLD
ncbi:MAG: YggS family pyridoxal phosphate-dependent enzyme [Pseudomonadales bacterium]